MIFHVMTCKIFAVLLYDIKCFLSHYLFFFLSLSLVKEDAMGQNRGMVEKVAQGGKSRYEVDGGDEGSKFGAK